MERVRLVCSVTRESSPKTVNRRVEPTEPRNVLEMTTPNHKYKQCRDDDNREYAPTDVRKSLPYPRPRCPCRRCASWIENHDELVVRLIERFLAGPLPPGSSCRIQ